MRAVVVRDGNRKIVCMGPDNGMYAPRVPDGCTKAVEEDYETLIQQHMEELAAIPKPPTIEERLAALEQKVG